MKYRDTYRIVTQVSRYVAHRDFRYRAIPMHYAQQLLHQSFSIIILPKQKNSIATTKCDVTISRISLVQ